MYQNINILNSSRFFPSHARFLISFQYFFSQCQGSERKAYNPKTFCRTYTMDKQPLNTGEQKDMTEFFTDLIGKIEEMSPALVRNDMFLLDLGSGSGQFVKLGILV